MLLAFDVGNTHITLGAFSGDTLAFETRLASDRKRTGDQYAIELKDMIELNGYTPGDFTGAVISSVVPNLSASLKQAVTRLFGFEPLSVGPGVKSGLNIKIDNPAQLGADMVAGAVAAIAKYSLPCIVYDLGTATTISVLDRTGNFLRGTVCGGVGVSLDALTSRTAQLPHISLETPAKVIGTNTVDCMKSGLLCGAAAMVDGMADRIEDELGEKTTLVATGGLAPEVVKSCRRDVILDGSLLLEGLRLIYERNQQ